MQGLGTETNLCPRCAHETRKAPRDRGFCEAGYGNRTRLSSLGSSRSTDELIPPDRRRSYRARVWSVRRKLVPAITALLAAAVVGLLVFGLTQQGASRALDQALAAQRHPPAPDAARLLPALD